MNIAFVNSTHSWGGVKSWTLDFATRMKQEGHNIFVYARPGIFLEKAASLELSTIPTHFGIDFNPFAIGKFVRGFKKNRIDAVITNVSKDMRTAGLAAYIRGIPVVQRIGLPRDMKNKWNVRFLHRLLKPHYLFPCRDIRDGFAATLPFIPPQRTKVIYSAKEQIEKPELRIHSPLQLVTTSQLNPDKGHRDLISALAELKEQGFSFHWHVAGTGSIAVDLEKEAARAGLSDRITWHGFRTDIRRLLSQCDIFVLPSLSEGLPNTLLEALSEGLIPIAYDVGGIREAWPEGLESFLVPISRGSSGLHEALRTALVAPAKQQMDWRQIAHRTALTRFHIKDRAKELSRWLEELGAET